MYLAGTFDAADYVHDHVSPNDLRQCRAGTLSGKELSDIVDNLAERSNHMCVG